MVRVYNCTGNSDYLTSAGLALLPYTKPVSNGGVLSHVFGQLAFPWYEEYPTEPGYHVLNGFMYSLIGLYDFSQVSLSQDLTSKAEQLWRAGLQTLSVILPLFDSGSGSFYDLSHVLPPLYHPVLASQDWISQVGPNRARWSYHALHIQQLRLLGKLDPVHTSEWVNTANRWSGYMTGLRSPHN
ncbi:heparosan-N-sulfate-glucuronate 5-epimerase [Paragonimus westermani]|uniref:Heparosan-N-sulfate-glucuronate 5-epimerase n=1 Tax=Paragonimus westermani TaxID=34504 RepID=A0A5J4P1T1_9TREM|nr:heparosan-N-sulfate-glucuronate 5-epimerase [Paragonimus westermani]